MAKKQKTKVTGAKTSTNNSSEKKLATAKGGREAIGGFVLGIPRAYRPLKNEGFR